MGVSLSAILVVAFLIACTQIPASTRKISYGGDSIENVSVCAKTNSAEKRLYQWLDERYNDELSRSTITMTFHGRKDKYNETDSFSKEAK